MCWHLLSIFNLANTLSQFPQHLYGGLLKSRKNKYLWRYGQNISKHTSVCHCCLSSATSWSEHLDSPSVISCMSSSLLFISPPISHLWNRGLHISQPHSHLCTLYFYPPTPPLFSADTHTPNERRGWVIPTQGSGHSSVTKHINLWGVKNTSDCR